jgi:hypothetical protein
MTGTICTMHLNLPRSSRTAILKRAGPAGLWVGGGVAFAPNWSAFIEFDYYDLITNPTVSKPPADLKRIFATPD